MHNQVEGLSLRSEELLLTNAAPKSNEQIIQVYEQCFGKQGETQLGGMHTLAKGAAQQLKEDAKSVIVVEVLEQNEMSSQMIIEHAAVCCCPGD